MHNRIRFLTVLATLVSYAAFGQTKPTQVVLLGTGLPRPDPKRSGRATAIVVNGTPYLIDAGPGIVRRAIAAYDKASKLSLSRIC